MHNSENDLQNVTEGGISTTLEPTTTGLKGGSGAEKWIIRSFLVQSTLSGILGRQYKFTWFDCHYSHAVIYMKKFYPELYNIQ